VLEKKEGEDDPTSEKNSNGNLRDRSSGGDNNGLLFEVATEGEGSNDDGVGTVGQSHVDPPLTDKAFDASGGGETNSGNEPRGGDNPDEYGSGNTCYKSTSIKTATTKEEEDTLVDATRPRTTKIEGKHPPRVMALRQRP